jgi:hypothetical protein
MVKNFKLKKQVAYFYIKHFSNESNYHNSANSEMVRSKRTVVFWKTKINMDGVADVTAVWLALMLLIPEVSGSGPARRHAILADGFLWFFSVPPGKWRATTTNCHHRFFPYPFQFIIN